MSILSPLGVGNQERLVRPNPRTALVQLRNSLHRLMAFRGFTIDDIVNNPITKNEALGYWKVFRQIERRGEILDLERQWNQLEHRL